MCQQWHATGVPHGDACTENCKHRFQTLYVSLCAHTVDTISTNFKYTE